MITAFIADKMSRYISGGMSAETAARFARGELGAIYKGSHYSRDASGAMRLTPPPEDIPIEAARAKCDEAIKEILDLLQRGSGNNERQMNTEAKQAPEIPPMTERAPMQKREGLTALEYMASLGIPLIGAYANKKMIGTETPENFTTGTAEIAALMEGKGNRQGKAKGTPIKRFYFIPANHGLFCLDIDAKEGKKNGIQELLKVFDPETLPDELRDIENRFPCYTKTPNNGYHLYFRYNGPPIKNSALFPGIETKHGKPGLTSPGSENAEGKPYILHGNIEAAPPLFGLLLAKIQNRDRKPEPQKAAADRRPDPTRTAQSWTRKPRIDLDTLAAETSGGNHDRQVQFSGKVYRLQMAARNKGRDYSEFTSGAALAYVKAHPDIFGDGDDTERTIKSVIIDNGGL
jgi:hypothetical protein